MSCLDERLSAGRRAPLALVAAAVLAVGGVGCRRRPPPQRPMALLFPTVYPSTVLEETRPLTVSGARLRGFLLALGFDVDSWVGRLDAEGWALLSRGLAQRGYAELDGRRMDEALQWIVLRGAADQPDVVVITAGFDKRPPADLIGAAGLSEDDALTAEQTDAYGRVRVVSRWLVSHAGREIAVRRVVIGASVLWTVSWRVLTTG